MTKYRNGPHRNHNGQQHTPQGITNSNHEKLTLERSPLAMLRSLTSCTGQPHTTSLRSCTRAQLYLNLSPLWFRCGIVVRCGISYRSSRCQVVSHFFVWTYTDCCSQSSGDALTNDHSIFPTCDELANRNIFIFILLFCFVLDILKLYFFNSWCASYLNQWQILCNICSA